jgi:L-asparagine oxygenase
MSLDHRFPDGSTAFDFDWSAEPAQSGAHSATDECSILSLTMDRRASRAFANLAVSILAVSTRDDRRMASTGGPDENPRAWLEFAAAALGLADPALVRSLRRAGEHACPVIVLRGLPVAAAPPPTPYDGAVDLDLSRQAIVNLHAVAASLGLHPIAYAGENASTLHAVCPTTGARGQASSRGFDAALPFHTDYADRPIDEPAIGQSPAAAALLFAVERAEPATPMQCVPLPRLLSALSPKQIRIACAPEFAVDAPDIFGGGQAARIRRLLLPDTGRGFRCRLNLGKMTGCTARAARLLLEIHEILSDESLVEQIHVRRGDIVVMDNQRAIHRRGVFTPRWDGADRYFVRMSAACDARAGIAADPGHPWLWS